jgi:hypothetical protein
MSDAAQSLPDKLRAMRVNGVEQIIPFTLRKLRIRTADPNRLMRAGKVPDILTPLVAKTIYQEVSDAELQNFATKPREQAADALAVLDSLNIVARDVLVQPKVVDDPQSDDEIAIEELTMAERRWIFRLALAPAEVLTNFRYQPDGDVELVAEGDDVPLAAEPSGERT